jgi:hypothetical protein
MGFSWADFGASCFKRQYRWKFSISNIIGEEINALPASRSGRPSFEFKEIQAEHITETIFFPGKVSFRPINISLFDIRKDNHPILEWVKKMYNPQTGSLKPSLEGFKIEQAFLTLYDGVGKEIEKWTIENIWAQVVDMGELDYSSNDVVYCNLTLRYDRAYLISPSSSEPCQAERRAF